MGHVGHFKPTHMFHPSSRQVAPRWTLTNGMRPRCLQSMMVRAETFRYSATSRSDMSEDRLSDCAMPYKTQRERAPSYTTW